MNNYMGAPETGVEWTMEDVWNLAPGELPPWNPDGIYLNPADFPDRATFEAEKNRIIDESGYRDLYDQWKRGRPGSELRYQTEKAEAQTRGNWLLWGGLAAAAALFAFAG